MPRKKAAVVEEPVEEPQPEPPHCARCGVKLAKIGGSEPMMRSTVQYNWRHDYSGIPMEERPKCKFMWGPLPDEEVA